MTEKDVGESCRNTSEKIKRRLKIKHAADRMTPEFKLSSEENSFRGGAYEKRNSQKIKAFGQDGTFMAKMQQLRNIQMDQERT